MPITRSGRCGHGGERGDRDRGRVRGEDRLRRERLVGAAGRPPAFDRPRSSTTASIMQVGRNDLVDGCDAREHLVGVGAALLRELLEALPHRREPALGRARERVVERDAAARRGDDLRDPAAHLPGADDEDVLEVHGARRLSSRCVPTVDVNGARLWYDEAGAARRVLLAARRSRRLGAVGAGRPAPRRALPHDPHRPPLLRPLDGAGGAVVVAGRRDRRARRARGSSGRRSSGSRSAASSRSTSRSRTRNACGRVAASRRGSAATTAGAYSEEQETRYEAAEAEGDLEAAMEIDLEVWAPLGADERIRQLWQATPDANGVPTGLEPLQPAGAPAKERLGELSRARRSSSPSRTTRRGMREVGPLVARGGARRAPRRARLRPLRDAARARARRADAPRLPQRDGAGDARRAPPASARGLLG